MDKIIALTALTLAFCSVTVAQTGQNTIWRNGRIRPSPSYLIAAPRRVRPDEVVQVYVSVMQISYPHLTVRAAIRREGQELAAVKERFQKHTTKLLQMQMPENAPDGNYTLRIEGSQSDGARFGFLFENETQLLFSPKRVSVFIQTDKAVYRKRSTVHFRVIALTQELLPVAKGSATIYVRDGDGIIVRRWLSKQLYNGIFETSFATHHPANHGWWTIEVHGWGYVYRNTFKTENVFRERFWPNITMPQYVKENEFALAGGIITRHQKGKFLDGNATVTLQIIPKKPRNNIPTLKREIPFFGHGLTSFLFPLEEIAEQIGKNNLAGTRLVAKATARDLYSLEEITGKAESYILDSGIRVKFAGGKYRTFKPGADIPCYVVLYESDGTPLQRSRARQLRVHVTKVKTMGTTSTDNEQVYIIPSDSVVSFNVHTDLEDEMVTVRVNYAGLSARYEEMIAYRHYTEKGRYIYISTSTKKPQVNKYMVFTVRVSVYVEDIKYVMTAGGRIVAADTIFMKSRQKTFSIALSRRMVPNARILVYAVMSDGEVLTDALNFHVQGFKNDDTEVRINYGKDFTKDTVEISGIADPGTYMAFSAFQYDLYLFSGNRAKDANIYFTEFALEEELATYDDHANVSFKHTWWEDEGRRHNMFFNAPSSAPDANTTFSFAGLLVFTDANIPRILGDELCNYTLGYLSCFDNTCFLMEQRCDGVQNCVDGADEMGCPEEDDVHRPDDFKMLHRHWWHLEDNWGWKSFYTKYYGQIDFTVSIPRRNAIWLVGGFALSVTKGLTFTEHPARLSTKRPLTCNLDMPNHARRGEQIGAQVVVFNTFHETLEVLLTVKASDKYKIVQVEDKGVVSSYDPRLKSGDVQVMVYIEPGLTKFIFFPILPTVIGDVEVVIEADSFVRKFVLKHTVSVTYDGITNIYHTPYFINLVSQGSQIIPDLDIPVPEVFIHPEQREHRYVPGSPKASVSLVGDVLGAGFNQYKHLDVVNSMHLINEGYGHEKLFLMSWNINWLRFLKATNQLSADLMTDVLLELTKDFDVICAFLTDDGGYSHRHKNERLGDVVLTALALETLTLASDPEYEHLLYIDVDILNKLASWLLQHQNKSGAFMTPSSIEFDIRILVSNKVTNEDGVPLNMTQTAFALIGLTKSLPVLTGDVQSKADSAARVAADYLAKNFEFLTEVYDICLVSYALHVAGHRDRAFTFQKLQEIKMDGEYIYWSEKPIPPAPTEIINTVPFLKPNELPLPWASRAIEGTSYALRVYLTYNRWEEAENIMEWLQSQRQSVNAWVGSQDTMAAAAALREYGERIANRHLFDMLVRLECTSTSWWKYDVRLARGNFLDFQEYKVPLVYGSVKTWATGTGLALLQMRTEKNVEYPWQIRQFPERSFDLDVNKLLFSGRNASHMFMEVCVKWARPDISWRSGSALLEIAIPTGFYVRRKTFERTVLVTPRVKPNRYRFVRHSVVLYLDYVDTQGDCYHFWGDRWFPVANATIQHSLRIMDLSEPGFQNQSMYTTYELFHLHICQVCGSYQCPYCPFYNTASTSSAAFSAIIFLIVSLHAILFEQPGYDVT